MKRGEKSVNPGDSYPGSGYWKSILENCPNPVIVVDRDLIIGYVNRFPGDYEGDMALGQRFPEYILPPYREALEEMVGRVFAGEEVARFECLFGLPGQELYWLAVYIGPVIEEGVIMAAALFVIDISQIKTIENRLLDLNKVLKEQNREMDNILHMASHDIKAPLVNIEGFVSELEGSIKELAKIGLTQEVWQSEKIEYYFSNEFPVCFKYIRNGVEKIKSLIYSLLNFANVRKKELTFEEVDVNALIGEIVNTLQYQISSGNVEIHWKDLAPCRGDKNLLNQLFTNLIDNAIKYLDQERKGIICITSEIEEEEILYCVEDNGIGIPHENQERIFEIFQRVRSDRAGSGVGLSIVKEVAALHNGRVWVDSQPGNGSCFYLALPEM